MCVPGRGTHITRDVCFLGRGTDITRDIPVSLGGEHILLVRCVSWVLDLISLRICFAQGGEHISLGIGEPC